MKKVLLLGAGRSSGYFIRHIAAQPQVALTVMDIHKPQELPENVLFVPNRTEQDMDAAVADADVVVSLLPPAMHATARAWCMKHIKPMLTASYNDIDPTEPATADYISKTVYLPEMGLDPGLDHISAGVMLDKIKAQGGTITSFKSYCGGLPAEESVGDNPWKYLIFWNPDNVVKAGKGTAIFREYGRDRIVPYHRLFSEATTMHLADLGAFDAYPNRDSVSYISRYGLKNVDSFVRGTLRYAGYCRAWQVLVQAGWTNNEAAVTTKEGDTYRDLTAALLPGGGHTDIHREFAQYTGIETAGYAMQKAKWLGIFSDIPVKVGRHTMAEHLKELILQKWQPRPQDKDRLVMYHEMTYTLNNTEYREKHVLDFSSGESSAMALGVGLPLAVATLALLRGELPKNGHLLPTDRGVYEVLWPQLAPHFSFRSATQRISQAD